MYALIMHVCETYVTTSYGSPSNRKLTHRKIIICIIIGFLELFLKLSNFRFVKGKNINKENTKIIARSMLQIKVTLNVYTKLSQYSFARFARFGNIPCA